MGVKGLKTIISHTCTLYDSCKQSRQKIIEDIARMVLTVLKLKNKI